MSGTRGSPRYELLSNIFCFECGSTTRVVNSRGIDKNRSIRRRRMCVRCGTRFSTVEKIERKKVAP